MEKKRTSLLGEYLAKKRQHRVWQRIVAGLGCLVVLGTISALTLPAITMNTPICGMEEHQHTAECYGETITLACTADSLGVHAHTRECYDAEGNLTCGLVDFILHTHDGSCYNASGTLVCTLPEIEEHTHDEGCYQAAEDGHQHGATCYEWVASETPSCGLEESEGHQHGDGCYVQGTELLCGQAESAGHTHTDACFTTERTLTCGQEETAGHTHEDACRGEDGTVICGMDETAAHAHEDSCYTEVKKATCGQEESPSHTHTAECYEKVLVCKLEEAEGHKHSAECYPAVRGALICQKQESGTQSGEPELVCEKPEAKLHTHVDACYEENEDHELVLICTEPEVKEHQHTTACIQAEKTLTCTIPEHTHTDACIETAALTAEEQAQVDAAVLLIDTLPTTEEVNAQFTAFDEAGDAAGREAYTTELTQKVVLAFEQYNALTENQRGAVTNAPKLMALEWLLPEEEAPALTEEEQRQVDDVISIIGGLPPVAELEAEFDRLEAAGETDALAAYREKVIAAVQAAFDSYNALTEPQKAAVTNADVLEAYAYLIEPGQPEDTVITAQGEGYALSVTYGADAALPEGTALQAMALLADSEAYQTYYAQLSQLLDGALIRSAWIYDINLQHGESEVEPAAPVTIQMDLDQPHTPWENSTYAVVHFAADGPEVLEVETIEADGQVTGFVHEQSSFSVTAYVEITPNPNPADNGPDSLPVNYYVYIDDEWTLVGSTKTGWTYSDGGSWSNVTRDRITIAQVESILGKYGYSSNTNPTRTIAYQLSNRTDAYSDTGKYTLNGTDYFPLSRIATYSSRGYNLYYLPDLPTYSGLNSNGNLGSTAIANLPAAENAFYTVSVKDDNHLVYTTEEERAWLAEEVAVVRSGVKVSATVKDYAYGWQWVGADGLPIDISDATTSGYEAVSQGDGTTKYSIYLRETTTLVPVNSDLSTATTSANTVTFIVWLDGQWTEVGSVDTIYYKVGLCQGTKDNSGNARWRWFVTSDQVYSVLAPFGFDPTTFTFDGSNGSGFLHQTASGGNLYSSGSCSLMADGKTWAIGMSYDNKDYKMYYVPGWNTAYNGTGDQNAFATEEHLAGRRFWSISIRDDNQLVYAAQDLIGTTTYALEGTDAVYTVHNASGVLWSSTGQVVEPVQADNKTTFQFTNVQQKIEVVATAVDPGFTVQYYANLERYVLGTSGDLDIIDTSGKVLPTNGTDPALKYLALEQTSTTTNQNNGTATYLHSVKTETKLTKLYTESAYQYQESPGLKFFDKLYQQSNYTLNAVLVLKEDRSPDSTNENDWWWYMAKDSGANITFTNLASAENAPKVEGTKQPNTGTYCILLQEGTVIRLLYENSQDKYTNQASFYDYDITDGYYSSFGASYLTYTSGYRVIDAATGYVNGINDPANYRASDNGKTNWKTSGSQSSNICTQNVYAFGNANCGTGMAGALWGSAGNYLNKHNSQGYEGCTFGLVTGLDSNGNLDWEDWLSTPALFSDGTATGKYTYNGGSLTFTQVGDTYTLTAANSTVGSRSGLEYFFNPSPSSSTTYTSIYTNNFWLMDNVPSSVRKDINMGAYYSGLTTSNTSGYGYTYKDNYINSDYSFKFPRSDDGKNHNWFFGMEFALTFSLTEDYVGPLEYIFFGDDDLWVFLDGQLICDIGGVHSSVGEYVNLRDYLPNGSSGQHTLKFFYTERGASGSTCWMSFTLPSVTAAITSQDTGSLRLEKSVQETDGTDANSQYADQEYAFDVALKTSQNGSALSGTYSFTRVDRNNKTTYGTVHDGSTLTLRAGDKITISGLPTGTWYSITETEESRKYYSVTVNGGDGYIVSGSISTGKTATASFVNKAMLELPATGGSGTFVYMFSGWALTGASALMYSKTRKKRRGAK